MALRSAPDNRLPVRRQDQASAGVRDLDPVAAGLVNVKKERLLNGVFVRAGLDEDAVFEEDVGGAQHVLAAVQRVGEVVEAASGIGVIVRISEIIALVGERDPHGGFGAVVENDLLGQAAAEIILKENAIGPDVDRQAVEVVEPAHVDAARRIALGLVLQRRRIFRRRNIALRFIVELDDVAVGIMTAKGGPIAELVVDPANLVT